MKKVMFEDLNVYLKRFKENCRLTDFPDSMILSDNEMLEHFIFYLKYSLKNKYYYSNLGD